MRDAVEVVQMSDYIISGVLKVRLSWTQGARIDYLPYYRFTPTALTPVQATLDSAVHSTLGDVRSALLTPNDPPVLLHSGEHIDLAFHLDPPAAGYQRAYYFLAKGKYTTLNRAGQNQKLVVLPKSFSFDQNYPNPFNPSTRFHFALPISSRVTLDIYNILGERVGTLIDADYTAGEHNFDWNATAGSGKAVASGVYFAKFTAGSFSSIKKMVVLK